MRHGISNALKYALNWKGGRKGVAAEYKFRILSHLTPSIEVLGEGGIRYFVDTRDGGVGFQVFRDGAFDATAMQDIVGLLGRETGRSLRNRVFVDIGANIGTTTALALIKYGAREAIAVEPAPRNLELLLLMLSINGLEDRARTYRVALSDRDGTATMAISIRHGGDDRVLMPGNWGQLIERPTVDVPMTTLDKLDIDFDDVSLVWMDVQGHEGHVLAGADRLLRSDVPVLIEYCPSMLREAGGLDVLHDLVKRNFNRCIDCRTGQWMAADNLSGLTDEYVNGRYTDVLLTRA
jgi:FkbM family methyltransferase